MDNTVTNLFFLIFAVVFTFIIGMFGWAIYTSIVEKRYNDSQPILTKDAKITSKKTEVSGGRHHAVSTSHYATFEFDENKQRSELEIDSDNFGLMAENDTGKLTFQGRRFLKFERN